MDFYSGGVFNEPHLCTPTAGHNVVIVGYDTDEDGTDYWLVKVSAHVFARAFARAPSPALPQKRGFASWTGLPSSHWPRPPDPNLQNSYGPGWGESGYLKIAKGVNMCGIEDYPVALIGRREI